MPVSISGLPSAATLTGTEALAVVQAGGTAQAPVSALRGVKVIRITASLTLGPEHANAMLVAETSGTEIVVTIPAETTWNPPVGTTIAVYNLDSSGTVRVKSYTTDYTVHALHPVANGNDFGVAESSTLVGTKFKTNGWIIDGGFTA